MKKLYNFLIEWYNNLNSIQKLILMAIGVIILIICVSKISNFSLKETILDYKNVRSQELIESSYITNDRKIYVISDNIVTDFLNTYIDKRKINDKNVTLKKYYNNALLEDYKYNISYTQFKKTSDLFFGKIYNEDKKYTSIPLEYVIKEIYVYSESRNLYIISVNTNTGETAYIGIKIDMSNEHKYNIFYLE